VQLLGCPLKAQVPRGRGEQEQIIKFHIGNDYCFSVALQETIADGPCRP
jgi:hypothetical protein